MGATSEHFKAEELDCPCCGVNNCTKALVDLLERIREAVGQPVHITSAYRCEAHNKAVHGSANSQHLKGTAADIYVSGITAAKIEDVARLAGARGIGRSDKGGFVHVDMRAGRTVAKWCYGSDGQQCAYYAPTEQV